MSLLLTLIFCLLPLLVSTRSFQQKQLTSASSVQSGGGIEFDIDGNGYLNCLSRENATAPVSTIKCSLPAENRRDTVIGCYALWNEDVILTQGCWVHQDVNSMDCNEKCQPSTPIKHTYFCCCVGQYCNKASGFY